MRDAAAAAADDDDNDDAAVTGLHLIHCSKDHPHSPFSCRTHAHHQRCSQSCPVLALVAGAQDVGVWKHQNGTIRCGAGGCSSTVAQSRRPPLNPPSLTGVMIAPPQPPPTSITLGDGGSPSEGKGSACVGGGVQVQVVLLGRGVGQKRGGKRAVAVAPAR